MVRVYYHIYAVDGVEEIIDEQISLIEKNFNFPFVLNVGISIGNDNYPTSNIIDKFYNYNKPNYRIRDIRVKGHEFTTLELIEKDKELFGDTDFILYLHTKGASKRGSEEYSNIKSWRHFMNYFNIEKCEDVFRILNKSEYNTYGVLFGKAGPWVLYSGNFWWMKASYAKTINLDGVKRSSRYSSEHSFLQMGEGWQPYSPYNREGENHYLINFNELGYK
jgi:hypothetical protein